MEKIKNSFKTRKFKSATYSFGMTAVALAIVILVNLIVTALPADLTKIDLSFNQMYTLTDTTEEFVEGISEDVTIYVISQTGSEDTNVMEMLDKYAALSSHITIDTVDPVLHPTFVEQYTEESVSAGSLLVVSAKRTKVIPYSDLYESVYNPSTYQSDTTGFDVEGQVTSALNYVTTDELPIIYTLEGHGVKDLSATLIELIEKNSVDVQTVNLLAAGGVPEDAACLMINTASSDLSADEANQIIEYLENGGRLFVVSASDSVERENLNRVLAHYGMKLTAGYAIENSSSNYYRTYPYYLIPVVKYHDITNVLDENEYLFVPYAEAIETVADTRTSVVTKPILTTSDESFLRSMQNASSQSIGMIDGDIQGPITIGMAATDTYNDVETRVVVYSSSYMTDDSANAQVSGNNYQLVTSTVNWLCGLDTSVAIDAKSFEMSYLQLTASDASFWTIVLIGVLPAACLLIGFVVWMRRRRR